MKLNLLISLLLAVSTVETFAADAVGRVLVNVTSGAPFRASGLLVNSNQSLSLPGGLTVTNGAVTFGTNVTLSFPTNSISVWALPTVVASAGAGDSNKVVRLGADGLVSASSLPATTVPVTIPPGAIMDFGGTNAPTGWFLCDGAAISRETYSNLYTVVGDIYGNGNGTTTFNLPDLRGRITQGVSTNANVGDTGGVFTVTLTTAELPAHTHGQQMFSPNTQTIVSWVASPVQNGYPNIGFSQNSGITFASSSSPNYIYTASTGSGTAFSNSPPYMVVNKIIKF